MSMMTSLTVLLLAIPMQSKCNDHRPFMVIMAIITAIMESIYGNYGNYFCNLGKYLW